MNDQSFPHSIFFEHQCSVFAGEEASFLDIDEMFIESFNEPMVNGFQMEESQPLFQDFFENTPPKDQTSISMSQPQKSSKPAKNIYKSSYNKNVCFNICQKTIKVIKKGTFSNELSQMCSKFGVDEESFKMEINKRKKDFTGPKALSQYVSQPGAQNKVFVAFMKWFLSQKYLRIALNEGEMKDVKAYIQYKNLVILPLLE